MISLSKDTFSKFQTFVQQLYMYSNVLKRQIHALPLFSSIIRGTPGPGCFLGRTLQVRTVTFSLVPPHPQIPILLLFALGCNSVCLHTCVDTAYLTETHRANSAKSKVSKCAPDKQVH